MVGRQRDVVRSFINQFRITGVWDARQGRSLNVLGGHRCAVSTVVSPCSITVNSLIELVTERKVQLVPVVKLPGIPVRIEVLEFFFCPRQGVIGLQRILCIGESQAGFQAITLSVSGPDQIFPLVGRKHQIVSRVVFQQTFRETVVTFQAQTELRKQPGV